MAGVGTRAWSVERAGTRLSHVKAAAKEIKKHIARAKDVDKDGLVSDWELKRALKGASKDTWSAVMGTFASTVGHVHNDPTKKDLYAVIDDAVETISRVNTSKKQTLEVDELRQLKTRMPARLIDYGIALNK